MTPSNANTDYAALMAQLETRAPAWGPAGAFALDAVAALRALLAENARLVGERDALGRERDWVRLENNTLVSQGDKYIKDLRTELARFQQAVKAPSTAVEWIAELQAEILPLRAKCAELEKDAARLREGLNDELEMARHRQYPEPFRVGAVYTQRGNIPYMLPIIHQGNERPDIALEVGGCTDAALTRTPERSG